jgi:two-component system, LytTR family, sensor kinase
MSDRSSRKRSAAYWALIVLAFTVIWLVNFNVVMTNAWATRDRVHWKYPLLAELTGSYAVLVLLPGLLWFIRRYPIERRNVWRRVPLHLLANVVFGSLHTLLMWGSRLALYRWLGWGHYDYGVMPYRFLMEGGKQIFTYWSVFVVVTAITYAQRSRERTLAALKLERELTEARLAALKMQLNPHFLFNTLNMISTHIHENPRLADAMLGRLSEFLRVTLRHRPSQEIPLEREIEFLSAYLDIMRARFEDRLAIDVDVAAAAREALVPHLILQPLVENSVTHCMTDAATSGHIRILASRDGERLLLAIEDNGPGLGGEIDFALGRGVGLSNTAERLQHLYGDTQRLTARDLPTGGLRLEIEIPWHSAPQLARPA